MQTTRGLHLVVQLLPLVVQLLDAALLFVFRNSRISFDERRLFLSVAAQHDVGTATGHVGRNRHALRTTRFSHDLRLTRVLLGVQHFMRQTSLLQQVR